MWRRGAPTDPERCLTRRSRIDVALLLGRLGHTPHDAANRRCSRGLGRAIYLGGVHTSVANNSEEKDEGERTTEVIFSTNAIG